MLWYKRQIHSEFMACVKNEREWKLLTRSLHRKLCLWPRRNMPCRWMYWCIKNGKKSLRDSERQERSWDTSDAENVIEWKLIKLKANRKLFLRSLCKHSPGADKVFTWSQTSSKLVSCSAFLLHTALLESLKHSTAFSLIAKTNKLLREMHCSFYFTLFFYCI